MDLDNFPRSESAKKMLSYVTKGWYDRSYIGKWLYEVVGKELDEAGKLIEELPYQAFVETATWGLPRRGCSYSMGGTYETHFCP